MVLSSCHDFITSYHRIITITITITITVTITITITIITITITIIIIIIIIINIIDNIIIIIIISIIILLIIIVIIIIIIISIIVFGASDGGKCLDKRGRSNRDAPETQKTMKETNKNHRCGVPGSHFGNSAVRSGSKNAASPVEGVK